MCEIDFQNLFSVNEIRLKLQQVNKTFDVNAFKIVKSKFGNSYLCYSHKYQRVFFANSQLKAYISKIQPDLKVEDGFYYRNDNLDKIVEFKIKAINEVNGQVELEFIKQNRGVIKNTDEVLPLSEDDSENKKVNAMLSNGQYFKAVKNKSKIIDAISDEITKDIMNSVLNKN